VNRACPGHHRSQSRPRPAPSPHGLQERDGAPAPCRDQCPAHRLEPLRGVGRRAPRADRQGEGRPAVIGSDRPARASRTPCKRRRALATSAPEIGRSTTCSGAMLGAIRPFCRSPWRRAGYLRAQGLFSPTDERRQGAASAPHEGRAGGFLEARSEAKRRGARAARAIDGRDLRRSIEKSEGKSPRWHRSNVILMGAASTRGCRAYTIRPRARWKKLDAAIAEL